MNYIRNLVVSTKDGYIFDLELRGNIVVIEGESGSGKSFLVKTILSKQGVPGIFNINNETNLENVVCINYYNKGLISNISRFRGKLVIIDNADILLSQTVADYIAQDMHNQYLIYSRGGLEFYISPNYYASIERHGKRFELKYKFSVPGWY